MRITRERLQEMIDEAVSDALTRSHASALNESVKHDPLYAADPNELLEFAKNYMTLAPDDRRALHEVLVGRRGIRPEVIDQLERRVGGVNRGLDAALSKACHLDSLSRNCFLNT